MGASVKLRNLCGAGDGRQQGPGTLSFQPSPIRLLGLQQEAGKTQSIDAESRRMLLAPTHGEEPLVIKQQVVGMQRLGIEQRISQAERQIAARPITLDAPCLRAKPRTYSLGAQFCRVVVKIALTPAQQVLRGFGRPAT